jgi:hypothetical protein
MRRAAGDALRIPSEPNNPVVTSIKLTDLGGHRASVFVVASDKMFSFIYYTTEAANIRSTLGLIQSFTT